MLNRISHIAISKATMSAAKRPASDSFGSSHLVVKRQKSNVELRDGRAGAVKPGIGANGALVQTVSLDTNCL